MAAAVATATAQPRKLGIEECRSLAVENNRNVKIAEQTAVKAAEMVGAMRANFLPQVAARGLYAYSNASYDYTVEGGNLPIYKLNSATGKYELDATYSALGIPTLNSYAFFPNINLAFETGNIFYGAAEVRQPIFMGGKITAAYRMACIGRDMAELNRHKTDAETLVAADEAYWNCVKARALRSTAEQYLAAVEEFYKVVENAVGQGMGLSNDLLKVEIKRGEAQLNLLRVINARTLADMNLCNTIGIELLTEIEVDTLAIDTPIGAATPEWDITSRPEYGLLQKQVEMKRQQVALTRADFLPQVGVQASYGYLNGFKLNSSKVFDDYGSFTALVSVSVPIFHWGEGRHKTNAARAEQAISELQQRDLEEKMNMEVQMYRSSLDEKRLQVKICRSVVLSAEENLRVVGNRYGQGMETTASMLEAQTEWQKASTDLIDAKIALRTTESQYLRATGRLTAESDIKNEK